MFTTAVEASNAKSYPETKLHWQLKAFYWLNCTWAYSILLSDAVHVNFDKLYRANTSSEYWQEKCQKSDVILQIA